MNAILAGLLPYLGELIGRFLPDPQKRLEAQQELIRMANAGELAQLTAQVQVIIAEATGNWLQRSWRPLMMLFFASLIGARWFGYSAPNMGDAEIMELWEIVKIGIGGYTIGRSVEKVAPAIVDALKK
jgi:hypothetical protein